MKIVYVGNFRHSWCTEVHVARDAERLRDVTVQRIQEPPPGQSAASLRHFYDVVETHGSDAQVLIYQRTWGLDPDVAIPLWRKLEDRGCQTVSYHLDLYYGLDREKTIDGDPFWSTGVVFTADGDPWVTEQFKAKGIDHRWLPAAIVSDEAFWSPTVRSSGADVIFVGSAPSLYHPEWPWRAELLGALDQRYGRRFRRYPIDNRRVHGRALSQLYTGTPVVVGDSLCPPGHVNYWSDRFYETVGRGGYLVGPNVPGIEQHFTSGEHLDLYDIGDVDHVFELVDQALADRDATQRIAQQGAAHVGANHTYRHRVAEMLRSLGVRE